MNRIPKDKSQKREIKEETTIRFQEIKEEETLDDYNENNRKPKIRRRRQKRRNTKC